MVSRSFFVILIRRTFSHDSWNVHQADWESIFFTSFLIRTDMAGFHVSLANPRRVWHFINVT